MALGQAVELWNRRFPPAPGTGLHDWGVDVAASEESLFVAGTTEVSPGVYKFFVSRYGHDGTLHQTVYWPGAAGARVGERALKKMDVVPNITPDGGVLVAVTGQTIGIAGAADMATVLFSVAGGVMTQVWERIYSNQDCEMSFGDDIPVDVKFDPLIKYVAVTGVSVGCTTGTDIVTLVYAVDGTPLLQRRWSSGGVANDWPVGVRFAGHTVVTSGTATLTYGSALMAVAYNLLDTPPTQTWEWTYHVTGRNLEAKGMAMHPDGSTAFYVAATSRPFSPGGTNADVALLKVRTSDGAPAWTPNFIVYNNEFNGDDEPAAIDAVRWTPPSSESQDHIYIAGYTTMSNPADKDALTLCYRDVGTSVVWLWESAQGASGDDRATAVHAVRDAFPSPSDGSRALVTGWRTNAAGNRDYMTMKYWSSLPTGLSWTLYYSGAASGLDAAGAAWARNFHEFYVTGSSFGGASLDDGLTVKYFDPIP